MQILSNVKKEYDLCRKNSDIIPLYVGHEICKPNHKFGPHTRKQYIVHFCISGCGKLYDKFGENKINAGELFIMRPNEITTYIADENTPWEYAWIVFKGNYANVFNTEKSVYKTNGEIDLKLRNLVEKGEKSPYPFISLLYELIYGIIDKTTKDANLVDKIIQYIETNINTTIADLSMHFNYERSYLYRIFKKQTGQSIKDYVTNVRMEQAITLLNKGYRINNTAFAVGYNDEFNFSKIFKKKFGVSPKEYVASNKPPKK